MRRSRSRGLPFPSASPLTALVDRLRGPERRFWGGVYQTSLTWGKLRSVGKWVQTVGKW
jgi:hypothetical protein